ncbi:MAG: MFS transporter [Ilumatobacteraceae bacterium]
MFARGAGRDGRATLRADAIPRVALTMLLARIHRPVPLYWTSFLIVGLSLSILGPALTELRDRAGVGIGSIGVLFVGQSAGYVVGSFVGGRLYDRYGGHHVYAGSLVVTAVGLASIPLLDSVGGLFASFVLVGVGAAVCDVGANALLLWELGSANVRSMNVLHLCFGLGALSAPLVVHLGLDTAVRGAAVLCVVIAGWAVSIPPPSVRPMTASHHPEQTPRLLGLIAVFFFLYVGLEVGFAGWVHTYAEEIDFSDVGATWLTATFWIGFTAGRLLSSLVGHLVRPKVILTGACASSVAVAVVLVVADGRAAPVWIATALFGLATAPQFPVMFSYLERRIHVTGSATAWFVGGAGVGGLVFPWLIGRWFDASGAVALPWSILVLSVLTVASFAAANRVLGG